jgi:hypothetical protein
MRDTEMPSQQDRINGYLTGSHQKEGRGRDLPGPTGGPPASAHIIRRPGSMWRPGAPRRNGLAAMLLAAKGCHPARHPLSVNT